ncbi:hypothetical protein LIA77_11676 [Sarocladium implicatum]|nr:hypothetical protein LIA77_11676 [Sarocladium implicatum]
MVDYEQISKQAEADLNTKGAKTGERGINTVDDGGANAAFAERKFESAEVSQGDELSTNAGYNKRIPPSEGGILDDRGPLDKIEHTGDNDNDVVPANVPKVAGLGSVNDIATQGQAASTANVGHNPPGPGGEKFRGENYEQAEFVPGSGSAEGNPQPASAIETSREAQNPDKFGPK